MDTLNYLVINLAIIRRTVLAEFLTIFALKIIFKGRNCHATSEEKKESKINLRSAKSFCPTGGAFVIDHLI